MSTQRLYYDDAYLQAFDARVLSCAPSKAAFSESGPLPAWEVVLDRSAFYPSSGGQPNDIGLLGEAIVLDVRDAGEDIVHIVDREVATGPVHGSIDWRRRFDHMQQHTGQHLLSAVFQEQFALPTVSFHLGSDLCTIDLRGPEPSLATLQRAQRAANEVIFADRAVKVRYGTAAELAEAGVRKEVEREGNLRAIEIAFADLQPCGGTHVSSTGQIGLLLVRRCSKVRQDWRVEFACGARAEQLAMADFQLLRALSERLSCAPEESLAALEKSFAERDAHYRSLRVTLQQLAEARAALLISATPESPAGIRVIAEVLCDVHPELLLPLATQLARNDRTIALLALEESGQLAFAQHPGAGQDLAALLQQVLTKVPGKGGGTRDFVRAKLTDARDSARALAEAKKLILG